MVRWSSLIPDILDRFSFTKRVHKGTFLFDIGVLLGGNVTGQLILIASTPVITRLYSPEAFGSMTVIISCIAVLTPITSLQYERAILLPKHDSDAVRLFALCLIISFFTSAIWLMLVAFFRHTAALWFGFHSSPGLFWVVPLNVIFLSWNNSLVLWHSRFGRFSVISGSRITIQAATTAFRILAALALGGSAWWLVLGHLFGFFISTILLGRKICSDVQGYVKRLSLDTLSNVARAYHRFPMYAAPTAVLNVISQNVPVFLLAYYFSSDIVGYYGLANISLKRPIQLIAESMTNPFLQRASKAQVSGKAIRPILLKATLSLSFVAFPFFLLFLLLGPWLFELIFGTGWSTAGSYAQALSPWIFLLFINPPATQTLIVKSDQKFMFVTTLVALICRVAGISIGYYSLNSAYLAILFFAFVGVLLNLLFIYRAFHLTSTRGY